MSANDLCEENISRLIAANIVDTMSDSACCRSVNDIVIDALRIPATTSATRRTTPPTKSQSNIVSCSRACRVVMRTTRSLLNVSKCCNNPPEWRKILYTGRQP